MSETKMKQPKNGAENKKSGGEKKHFSWKKFWKKCGGFIRRLFTVNKGLKAVSVLIAIVIWLTIVLTTSSHITGTVSGVPIIMDLTDTAVGKLGLSVVSASAEEVRVTLYGKRDGVRTLTKNPADIKVTGQLNKVNAAGTYEIDLMAALPVQIDGVRVQSISPSTITVRFDTVEKKTVPVIVDYSTVKIGKDLICMQPEYAVQGIIIQGPAADLAKVDHAVAEIKTSQRLEESKEFVVPLRLTDEKGVTVDASHITMEKSEVSVVLPIYKAKKVPLKVNFVGPLSDELLGKIPYKLDRETVEIAGPPDKLDSVNEIVVATVNLADLKLGTEKVFEIPLPAGFEFIDNVSTVHFTFKPDGWGERTFHVRHFEIVNTPKDVSAKVLTNVVYQVHVVGPRNVLSKLTADQLICRVDLLDKSLATGKWNYAATVQIGRHLAWATGQYQVTIQIKA